MRSRRRRDDDRVYVVEYLLEVLRNGDRRKLPPELGQPFLSYVDRDDQGYAGITVRDVTETSLGPPRRLAGFDPLTPTESFAVTRDGSRIVLSVVTSVSSIAVADNVPGSGAGATR